MHDKVYRQYTIYLYTFDIKTEWGTTSQSGKGTKKLYYKERETEDC